MSHPVGRLLNEAETAQQLNVSMRTLQSWRVSGRGPFFIRLGRKVAYDPWMLARWIEQQTRASTSANGAPKGAIR